MKILKSESATMPLLIDTESSKTKVYVRSNIVEEVREDCTMFVYDEIQYTKEEFANIRIAQLIAENKELDLVVGDMIQLLADKGVIY